MNYEAMLKESVFDAVEGKVAIAYGVAAQVPGMIDQFGRRLFSALGFYASEVLEVGSLCGASACAFGYKTAAHVTMVDSFESYRKLREAAKDFGFGRETGTDFLHCQDWMLKDACRRYVEYCEVDYTLYEKRIEDVELRELPRPEVVYYDGNHDPGHTEKFLLRALDAWPEFVLLVDDFHVTHIAEEVKSISCHKGREFVFPKEGIPTLYASAWRKI